MSIERQRKSGQRYVDVATGRTIDAFYPADPRSLRSCLALKYKIISTEHFDIEIDLNEPIASTEDAYLRLYSLSNRSAQPNSINLEGLFEHLPNVAWTSAGPVLAQNVDQLRTCVAGEYHHLIVFSVDKFPRMLDYIVPDGVRVADGDRVRLGAHLAVGTTVMHEGFVNFNAGTLGRSMVEGRITPGVAVGADSDVGAGASIMGTLSGGGKSKNSIGERSLLGANAGIGISLGDECIVEAGLYVTAGTKVKLPDGTVVAARQLSGKSHVLFRRNSQSGVVEALPTDATRWGGLNVALHGSPSGDS
jgi:2,3,4,5-tetrahydropyridine-2,6-dicarboxylate N-succinyltransferase